MSGAPYIRCRKGNPCNFVVEIPGGLAAQYTQAKFQARDDWDETLPALIEVDESSMTFDRTDPLLGKVYVNIGATVTDDLPVTKQPRQVAAMLRVYNPSDADDRRGWAIPFQLQPEVIVDV